MAAAERYVLRAILVDDPEVSRTLALAGEHTLERLHDLLREAFGWHDDHLYSFWLSGVFWDEDTEYTAPVEAEPGAQTAAVRLDELGLRPGQTIAYVFDFGDEWRVELEVLEAGPAAGPLPAILAREGEAPPQYPRPENDELGAGG